MNFAPFTAIALCRRTIQPANALKQEKFLPPVVTCSPFCARVLLDSPAAERLGITSHPPPKKGSDLTSFAED